MLYKHLSRKTLQHDRSEQQTITDIKEQFFSEKWFHKKKKALSHFAVLFFFFFPGNLLQESMSYACFLPAPTLERAAPGQAVINSAPWSSEWAVLQMGSWWHFCNLRAAQTWPKEDFLHNMAAASVTNAPLGWSTFTYSRGSIQHGKDFSHILRDEDRRIGLTEWSKLKFQSQLTKSEIGSHKKSTEPHKLFLLTFRVDRCSRETNYTDRHAEHISSMSFRGRYAGLEKH